MGAALAARSRGSVSAGKKRGFCRLPWCRGAFGASAVSTGWALPAAAGAGRLAESAFTAAVCWLRRWW